MLKLVLPAGTLVLSAPLFCSTKPVPVNPVMGPPNGALVTLQTAELDPTEIVAVLVMSYPGDVTRIAMASPS